MSESTVAALFVGHPGVSSYHGLQNVVPYWISSRKRDAGEWLPIPGIGPMDARDYDGPWPVVAHPPCARWCQLAGLIESRLGYKRGDDGGCFASALASVRRYGGVLERPAFSSAWPTFGLARPPRQGGWVLADSLGGWTCSVEQARYGHPARKTTWLYAAHADLPDLLWGSVDKNALTATVSWCGSGNGRVYDLRRLRGWEASATPDAFREQLLAIARSVDVPRDSQSSGVIDMVPWKKRQRPAGEGSRERSATKKSR